MIVSSFLGCFNGLNKHSNSYNQHDFGTLVKQFEMILNYKVCSQQTGQDTAKKVVEMVSMTGC